MARGFIIRRRSRCLGRGVVDLRRRFGAGVKMQRAFRFGQRIAERGHALREIRGIRKHTPTPMSSRAITSRAELDRILERNDARIVGRSADAAKALDAALERRQHMAERGKIDHRDGAVQRMYGAERRFVARTGACAERSEIIADRRDARRLGSSECRTTQDGCSASARREAPAATRQTSLSISNSFGRRGRSGRGDGHATTHGAAHLRVPAWRAGTAIRRVIV